MEQNVSSENSVHLKIIMGTEKNGEENKMQVVKNRNR